MSLPIGHPLLEAPVWWHPEAPREGWVRLFFRRRILLEQSVDNPVVHISASMRFELWLDGELIRRGPSRADPERWGAVSVELPTLAAGTHTLAIVVHHFGTEGGKGQLGGKGFLLLSGQGIDARPQRCWWDTSTKPCHDRVASPKGGHFATGAGDAFTGAAYPWGWLDSDFDDSDWPEPKQVANQVGNPWGNQRINHTLVSEPLPAMAETLFELDGARLNIPKTNSKRLILDRGHSTNAWPTLRWSAGKGSRIHITACEAPVDPDTGSKNDRNRTEGNLLPGPVDEILPDGGENRSWSPAWFRSFRYLVIDIITGDYPLRLEGCELSETTYPVDQQQHLDVHGDGRNWDRFLDVDARTAALCSHETFFDCPHYEQSQFPGDARIQCRRWYLVHDDDRLPQKAMNDLASGRCDGGLLRSHYPARMHQIISTYSLHWIGMLEEFRRYRGNHEVIAPLLPQAREILEIFERSRSERHGLVGSLPAPFTDWTPAFHAGCPPTLDDGGGSSVVTALYAEACSWMAELEVIAGYPSLTEHWRDRHRSTIDAVTEACWDDERELLADTPERSSFSVHAQVQAVLAGAWGADEGARVLERALDAPPEVVVQPGTLYYRSHLAEALRRVGLRRRVVDLFTPWFGLLDDPAIKTWPESDGDPRSDCHGWGTMPAVEMVHTVLGIEPQAEAWGAVAWTPVDLGFPEVSGSVPHPDGGRIMVSIADGRARIHSPVPVVLMDSTAAGGATFLPSGKHERPLLPST